VSELLDLVLNAHGGLERWHKVQTIELKLSITGGLFKIKGFPEGLPNVAMHIEVQSPAVIIDSLRKIGQAGLFRSGPGLDRGWRRKCHGRAHRSARVLRGPRPCDSVGSIATALLFELRTARACGICAGLVEFLQRFGI